MNGRIQVNRITQVVVGGVIAFGLVATAFPDSIPSTRNATITVLSDRYIVDDLAFDDLDYLEKHITTAGARSVELLICGPDATRPLKAVVHRFRNLPLKMRLPDLDESECMSTAPLVTPVRQRAGRRPYGIDDDAVERYWLDIMP